MSENYKFNQNTQCEFFPCHKTENPEEFSCLFCYCPLFALGDKCGGNFSYTETGIKDCSNCLVPHKKENYDFVLGKYALIAELVKPGKSGMQHVTIHSKDMEASVKFYTEVVGLSVRNKIENGPMKITFLTSYSNDTAIEIIGDAEGSFEGKGISVGFKADDVDKKRSELEEKGLNPSPMVVHGPAKFFFVKDPNGFTIQFTN